MAKKLVSLKVQHIAGVDLPANKKKFLIVKSEIAKQVSVKEEDGKWCVYDGDEKVGEYASEEEARKAASEMNKRKGATMLTKEQIAKVSDKSLQEAIVQQQEEMAELEKQVKAKDDEIAKIKSESPHIETDDEKLWKNVPPAIRNRYDALMKDKEEVEKRAKEEKDARETEHWTQKVKELQYIPQVIPGSFGKIMKNVAEKCPTEANEIFRVLTLAEDTIAKGDLFRELGRNGTGSTGDATDVSARVSAMAEEFRKRDPKLGVAESIEKVFRDHPDWHTAYKKQVSVQV